MRTMRLYIKTLRTITTKGEGWHEIDLYDNVSIPLTFKVSDIREFGSKTSGYSLDFEIPHTNNNGQLFGIAEEIDAYDATFEWGKDYPAYLTNNGLVTFNGQFRLRKVMKKDSGRHIYYIGYLYGGAKTFVDTLGTQTLIGNDEADDDIDFTYLNTPSTQMRLADFANRLSVQYSGWGLTLIDKTNKGTTAFQSSKQSWDTTECSPYLFVKEIVDQIFEKAGYLYDSDFFSHAGTLEDTRWRNTIGQFDFLRLIYAYMQHNSNIHGDFPISSIVNQISEQSFADVVTGTCIAGTTIRDLNIVSHSLSIDSTKYTLTEQNVTSSLASWSFTATESGQYKVAVKMPLTLAMYMRRTTDEQPLGERQSVQTNIGGTKQFTLWVQLEKNGRTIANDQRIYHNNEDMANYYEPSINSHFPKYGWVEIVSEELAISLDNLQLAKGDVLTIYTWISVPVNYWNENSQSWQPAYSHGLDDYYPSNIALRLSALAEELPVISISRNDGFYEGASFYPNSILNPKTTKVDFFANLLKMFNLYVEDVSGKLNHKTGVVYDENTLRIEPYEIFYAPNVQYGSNRHDWTDKIDWESVEYRRCDDYLYNIQAFTKEQNEDFYDEDYNATYIVPYGNRNVKGKYCVSADKNEISPKVGAYLCGIVNSQTDTLQCPKAFKINNRGEVDTKKEYAEGIFFLWNNDMSANTEIGTNNAIKLQSVLYPSSYIDISQYGCADTANDGYGNDTANLNFGKVGEFYQVTKGKELSDNDLYNAFYKKQYDEFTSADAKIMRCRIFLTAYDIATLQMSDTIIVKGNAWHIVEINQWKNEREAVEIELIKTKPNR